MTTRWVAPLDPARLATLRVLVAGFATCFLAGRSVYLFETMGLPATRWRPLGLLGPFDAPPPPAAVSALLVATVGLGVAATLGWRYRVSGPAFAAGFILLATYGNSWGQLFHTEHLMALHLVVVGVAPAAHCWSLDAAAGRAHHTQVQAGPAPATQRRHGHVDPYGWPVRLLSTITVLTYVIAGVAKLRLGGGAWLNGDALAHQVAFDNARKVLVGSLSSPLGSWLAAPHWWWAPAALTGLAVELGAPAALLWRRARRWWAAAAWGFHVVIVVTMAIVFVYPLSGIAFASMFAVEKPVRRLGLRFALWSNRGTAPSPSGSPLASSSCPSPAP